MLQLTYITLSTDAEIDIDAVLKVSRLNNARDGMSGLLIFDGVRFLQALEGEGAAVTRTFERIRADPRHRALVTLARREVDAPQFGDWSMAWTRVPPVAGSEALADTVDALTAGVTDANMRALFRSFVRLDRRAA
jgi:hypothetical protein